MRRIITAALAAVLLSSVATAAVSHAQSRLRFGEDGKFKIVQFSDIHLDVKSAGTERSARTITSVVERERPQLIVLTGDVVTYRPADEGWRFIADLFGGFGIPWCVTMGNHDGESPVPGTTGREIFDFLAGQPGYVGSAGAAVKGVGNFALEIAGSRTDRVEALVYCLDSGSYPADPRFGKYDWIGFDQIAWYRETGDRYRAMNGGAPLPSLMFFHIPLPEIALVTGARTTVGSQSEGVSQGGVNSGMFGNLLTRGDVMGTFSGHDHDNDYAGIYRDILLSYCRVSGADAYGDLERGGRVIELYEGERRFDTWIATPRGVEHLYYYPSGISRADETSMEYLPALDAAPTENGVRYGYYEGDGMKETSHIHTKGRLRTEGVARNISLSPATAEDHFGLEFTALIEIPARGVYRFYTVSDDGSRLWIDGRPVVDNDGSHDARRAENLVALEKGFHHLRLLYFEDYMGERLEAGLASRTIGERPIPDEMLFIDNRR